MLFRPSQPPTEPAEPASVPPAQTVQLPETPPPATPGVPAPAKEATKKLEKDWIPDPTGLVVAVRWNRLAAQGRLLTEMESFSPEAVRVGQRLLQGLHLAPEKVEHLVWLAVDGVDWPNRSVILAAMAEEGPLADLSQRGQPCGFRVGDAECRKDPTSDWPHPFVRVAPRWVLTGPEVLLRHIAERSKPQLQSRALERMIDRWPWTPDVAVGVDSSRLRPMANSAVQRLAAVWPESRRPLQVLWEASKGFSSWVYFEEAVRLETAAWCETPSEAEQVRAALEEFLGASSSALGDRLQRLAGEVQAGQWKADQAAQYEKLLKVAQTGVQSARLELAESIVWVRTAWKSPWPEVIGPVFSAQEALRTDWEAASVGLIQQQEQRLLQALSAYGKAEGRFPPGAEGGPLWDPATRLSWIALVLPYMGRADWYQQLQLRYPWNSPQNRPVAQRPLEELLNPALPERATEAGFPVTHYVGMGGLGEDAVQPQADQRRIGVFGFGRTLKPEEITDGLSHTIAIAGVSSRLGPWASGGSATVRPFTQPPYVNGPDGFGTGQPDGMFVGMADGSVRFISKNVDPRVLEMLATARGMERIDGLAWEEAGPKVIRPGSPAVGPSAKPPGSKEPAGPSPSETAKTKPAEGPAPGQTELKPPLEGPSEKPPAIAEKAGVEKEKSAPTRPAEQQAETEARLAEKVASIELPGLPLRKAIGVLESLSGVSISYDLEQMETAGVSLETPVRVKQTDVSIGAILQGIVEPLGLVYLVEGKDVLITRPPAARQQWRSVRYDVSDLDTGAESEPEDLARLVERFVLPESWERSGGAGKIEVRDETLLVYQTDLGHRRVVELLEKLRLARRLPLRIEPGRKDLTLQTQRQKMRSVLERPITANFGSPTPLPEILAYLEQLGQVAIVVDWLSLRAEGHEPTTPATLRANQQPLAEALKNLLEPLGLSWRIAGPELLQVTTQRGAAMRFEVEFYPASEAIAALGSAKTLLEGIKEQVGRGSWEDPQGQGAVYFDASSKYLIVLQNPSVHAELERFLAGFQTPKPASP